MRHAGELEQASLALAARVDELEKVADRLAERVVERERELGLIREQLALKKEIAVTANAIELEADQAMYDGVVEVEVGPLSDFAQLVGFEDAANDIDATGGISVKGFAQGRATIELHLTEPVELLRELEERAPFEFKVRDTREGRVILDVDAEAA